jgi:hypothetical protein
MAESAVSAFERIKHTDEQGEYWLARELGKGQTRSATP